ncbi:UbiA family prenyltransferase [Archangium violaceum]|uniref:UbiA family prenyltransferase n=1 Tax=Archangium violaceum TaxID=83451 RepID=UPI00193AF30C|nr:UbiA family prenyltransferase [Archangium violaceum]QRK05344.1 UbiA family prenyltransferase [Archangium violaceum]
MEHLSLLSRSISQKDVSASAVDAEPQTGREGALALVYREVRLVWDFIRYDLSSTVVPMFLFMLAAAKHGDVRGIEFLAGLGRGLIYFVLFVLSFCIANQMAGVEEDRMNKPDRPLARGDVSLEGARVRWLISMGLFTLVGWWFGVLKWTVGWQAIIYLHNFRSWAKHWLTKDLSMGLGVLFQLLPSWALMSPLTPEVWRWTWVLATTIFLLVPVQDLRDMAGDRLSARRTMPLEIGEWPTRLILAAGFSLLPLAMHFWMFAPEGASWTVWGCEATATLISLMIAGRVLLLRTPRADHWTYVLFTIWFCVILGSAIILL